jgi:anaerobic ribonucleoside-triphosphate reductase activating protein
MNYIKITPLSLIDGDGARTVLWAAGCPWACKGCHSPETWDKEAGKPFDEDAKEYLFKKLGHPLIDGLTLSGGDPMMECNRDEIIAVAREAKRRFPEKDIWMYSGYKYEDIRELSIINDIDTMVDGEFHLEIREKNPDVHWRGDETQRIIDVPKSLASGDVVLRDDLYRLEQIAMDKKKNKMRCA